MNTSTFNGIEIIGQDASCPEKTATKAAFQQFGEYWTGYEKTILSRKTQSESEKSGAGQDGQDVSYTCIRTRPSLLLSIYLIVTSCLSCPINNKRVSKGIFLDRMKKSILSRVYPKPCCIAAKTKTIAWTGCEKTILSRAEMRMI